MAVEQTSAEQDIFQIYIREVQRYALLTPEQEREYGRRAQEGDEEAQHALVTHNLRFGIKMARTYQNSGIPLMDLIEAANEGLMHAARKYKPDEKPRFVSYAVWWIRQYIQKLVDQQARQMSNSMTQVQLNRRVQREQNNALRTLGRQLTIEELVEITKRPRARIEEALSTCIIERSLDEPVDSDEAGSYTLAQMIGDSDRQAEREFERERLQTILRIMRETLDEREFRILVDFFGLNGIREMSFLEIGNTMGITRERVRQLGRRALGKLAKASEHHEELLNYFTPKPGHRLGEFRINSRRKSPLPPEEQEARRQQRAGRRTKEKAT